MKNRLSRILNICFLLLVVVSAVSCARGNSRVQNEDYLVKITEGKTTKAEVKEILGKPQSIISAGAGTEHWRYFYMKAGMLGSTKMNTVTIDFDDKGVVTKILKSMAQ